MVGNQKESRDYLISIQASRYLVSKSAISIRRWSLVIDNGEESSLNQLVKKDVLTIRG